MSFELREVFAAGLGRRRAVAALWRAAKADARLHSRQGCLPLRRVSGEPRVGQGFQKGHQRLFSAALNGTPPSGCLARFGSSVGLRCTPVA